MRSGKYHLHIKLTHGNPERPQYKLGADCVAFMPTTVSDPSIAGFHAVSYNHIQPLKLHEGERAQTQCCIYREFKIIDR